MKATLIVFTILVSFALNAQQDKNAAFAEYAKQFQKPQQSKYISQSDLKKDISKHVNAIAVLDKPAIVKMAATLHANAKNNLTLVQLQELDKFFKESTNDCALVNQAMLLYAEGIKTDAPVYLISSVIDHSSDPWFINNLGVILKSNEVYEKAIACFLYADKNLKTPSAVVKTNLGWATAYYGDFDAAKKFFNDALKIAPSHDGALEGLCHLAYAEGDFKALMENLYKRVKLANGGGGNVNQFVAPGLLDDILETYETNSELKKTDPFETHLFDNDAAEDNVYNPGGATEIIPKLPAITAFFSYDAFGLNENMDVIQDLKKELARDREKDITELSATFKSLPPWKKEPYWNEQNDLIIPYNYEAEYKMFERITVEFNKRDIWLAKQSINEEMAFDKTIQVGAQLVKMLNACAGKADCICQWSKPNLGVVNSDLSGYFSFWSKLYKQWLQNVNWYIAATSGYIKKVHHPQLNAYLNRKREVIVRDYILSKYSTWLDDCLRVGGEVQMLQISKECANNPPKTSIAASEEVLTPPLKKLKRWPEPCVVPTGDYDSDDFPAGIVMTCDQLRLRFGVKKKIGDIGGSAALHLDFKFDENPKLDEVKIYLQGNVKAGLSKGVSIEGKNIGEIGVEGNLKGTAFIQFKEGKTNYGVEGVAEVSESVGAKSIEEGMSKNEKDLAKKIDNYLPGAEIKAGGSVIWTAETGPKVKVNGIKTNTSNIPGE